MVKRLAAVAALAGALAGCAGPGVAVWPRREGGTVFEWRGPADAVELRGSMTGWEAVPLPRARGAFRLVLSLPPGRYEYRLEVRRGDSTRVVLPDDSERVGDGFGGENAVLRVP